jgi:ABC-2 type transport system permease protein/oleandomycin transport system permease protein
VLGRVLADSTTNAWSIITTAAIGFLIGFRLGGSVLFGLLALGLCLIYCVVFTVVFIVIGLFAPNAQAAQGMSLVGSILAFVSSTYVPVDSMPSWLQLFAKYQPISPMVNAVRSLTVGSSTDVGLALIWSAVLLAVFAPIAVLRYRRA